jgi:hypothetical protein
MTEDIIDGMIFGTYLSREARAHQSPTATKRSFGVESFSSGCRHATVG